MAEQYSPTPIDDPYVAERVAYAEKVYRDSSQNFEAQADALGFLKFGKKRKLRAIADEFARAAAIDASIAEKYFSMDSVRMAAGLIELFEAVLPGFDSPKGTFGTHQDYIMWSTDPNTHYKTTEVWKERPFFESSTQVHKLVLKTGEAPELYNGLRSSPDDSDLNLVLIDPEDLVRINSSIEAFGQDWVERLS